MNIFNRSFFMILTLVSGSVVASPIKKMGQWKVIQKPGSVPRAPVIHDGVLDVMHGSPLKDPSTVEDSHFGLKKVVPQALMALYGVRHPQRYDHSVKFESLVDEAPYLFNYFKLNQDRYTPSKMTSAASPVLVNSEYEFKDISDRKFGFCWGYATLNRFFSQVAFFDPRLKHPDYEKNNQEWFNFYKIKIDKILSGTPQVIPGFKNYREFTLVPEIEFYLKLKTTELWATRAVTKKSLSSFYNSTTPLSNEAVERLLSELTTRLTRAELPKIMFTAKNSVKVLGGSSDIHVVLVTSIERFEDGAARINIWDSNFYAEEYLKDPKSIEIRNVKGKLEMHFGPWYEVKPGWNAREIYESTQLGQVRITPENDLENILMLKGLRSFCEGNQNYCK